MNSRSTDSLEALFSLSPREFEVLVANLYKVMGYKVILTAPQRDGGRDVIAERSKLGEKQRVLIEVISATFIGVGRVRNG
ncbi:restriction endonuclease [Nocardia yunnanensis]|uniref:Restriction endonuclease n=1 Tax=Nocardia yunnanensis TaxID=2382165 RepID=A0A386ZEZ6_9NOCA|nr:restriction endonuclease [Nocardia yunnanensis]